MYTESTDLSSLYLTVFNSGVSTLHTDVVYVMFANINFTRKVGYKSANYIEEG